MYSMTQTTVVAQLDWVQPDEPNSWVIANPSEPPLNVTAFTARQKVSGYVSASISHMMGGDEPALLFSNQRLVWRVPIVLTSPTRGRLGFVGSLDIDARSGHLLILPSFTSTIQSNAKALLERLPSATTT